MIAQDPKSAEVIKPFLAGRDIKRYAPPHSEKYPAIKNYLAQFKQKLMPRPKDWKGGKWPGRKPGGIDCETRLLVRGFTPDEDLVHYANEEDVDEIVIGIRKRSKVGKRIFGSTAQHAILNAHCPVVTVK